MNDFYKQDIFFLVTTIAVVILTIALAIISVYVIKILKDVKYLSKKASTEADKLSDDLTELRQEVRMEGFKVKHALGFFNKIFNRHSKK